MSLTPPRNDDSAYRFGGIARLYGQSGFAAFQRAHVAVIGIGGVGTWAAEALARSGVGRITLIDLDEVCISNTNRQIHALEGQYGKPKVEVMAERIRAINPRCDVNAVLGFITPDNLAERLPDDLDAVVDAIDSVKAKTALIAWCHRRKLYIVCAGGAGGQMDPTLIQVADLSRTTQDPLLAKVRHRLRREYGFSRNPQRRYGIECVYSTEQLTYPTADGGTCLEKPASDGPVRLDCASGFGASTCVTACFGMVAASRVLNRLARKARHTQASTGDADAPPPEPTPAA